MSTNSLNCDFCHQPIETDRSQDRQYDRQRRDLKHCFCSKDCFNAYIKLTKNQTKPCGWCGKQVTRWASQLAQSKSSNMFCNQSCSASYNNTKKRASRRSKCEALLYEMIVAEFPKLTVLPNDKSMLDGLEVDIGIPSLNLAIEWNGIVHFEPIYGDAKLSKIQTKDAEKRKTAQDKGIHLIVVPDLVSTAAKVKEAFAAIRRIIQERMG